MSVCRSFQELTLERARYAARMVLSRYQNAAMMEADTLIDMITGNLVIQIERSVWAESPKVVTISHPRDWWQHVKQRWFPAWALGRWPVVETVHSLEIQRLYPDYIWKEQRPHMRISLAVRDQSPPKASDDDDYDAEFYS